MNPLESPSFYRLTGRIETVGRQLKMKFTSSFNGAILFSVRCAQRSTAFILLRLLIILLFPLLISFYFSCSLRLYLHEHADDLIKSYICICYIKKCKYLILNNGRKQVAVTWFHFIILILRNGGFHFVFKFAVESEIWRQKKTLKRASTKKGNRANTFDLWKKVKPPRNQPKRKHT